MGDPATSRAQGAAPGDHEAAPMRVAIVGMACRLPGQVSTPEELWQLCSRGRSAWSEIPSGRFNAAAFYHPNPDRQGTFNPKGGHFLEEDVGLFDAPFFNMSLQEARSLDPQQRLLLECTYEALENAGITKKSIAGANVGVFAGASFPDYEMNNSRDPETIPMYQSTGCAMALQSNRISYYFDLKGPSFTVDTACSSGLYALHLACQSLRLGECSTAIVGGCHMNLLPESFISMSLSRLFSDSGRSYMFDHKANGYGRGEGACCLVLKPYHVAEMSNDSIRAVIVNSGVNQDGHTQGIAMPNGTSQEMLIRSVYEAAQIDHTQTGYVEAHGTGTQAGDPIEAAALHAVFGKARTPTRPLFVGSVKSNIGHLEGVSGIAGVIKTALMLEKGFILPNYGFEKANDDIPLEKWNMKVPTKLMPWPRDKRYASVNNFGFGGSNAHVILERAPLRNEGIRKADPLTRKVYALSGHDKRAVLAQVRALGVYLEKNPVVFDAKLMQNLAYTLGQRRTFFPWRLAIPASSHTEFIERLSTEPEASHSHKPPSLGYVFTGQGAQWYAMGKEPVAAYPVFQRTMETVDEVLKNLGAQFSILDELLSKDETTTTISRVIKAQPACTAVQIALVDLLRSWGIRPGGVVGHSSGEVAAAYAAEILSLEDCVRLAYSRGLAASTLVDGSENKKGAMIAIGSSAEEVQQWLNGLSAKQAVIACVNSESSVTVSGDIEAIDELQSILEERDIFSRRLRVEVAYHSHHMRLIAGQYRELIGDIKTYESAITFHSTTYGRLVSPAELVAEYWVDNLLLPVHLVQGVRSLITWAEENNSPINDLIEIGPHSALQTPLTEILRYHFPKAEIEYLPSLKREMDAVKEMQRLASTLFTKGLTLDFQAVNFPRAVIEGKRQATLLTNLTTYPWNHSDRHWHCSRIGHNLYHRPFPRNDLLGSLTTENVALEPRWRNIIRIDDHPWIRQHKVHDTNVYPLAGMLAIAIEGIIQLSGMKNIDVERIESRQVSMEKMLVMPEDAQVEIMLAMRPYTEPSQGTGMWYKFTLFSWAENRGWEKHCHGLIMAEGAKHPNPVDGLQRSSEAAALLNQRASFIRALCTVPVSQEDLYSNVAATGMRYGPVFTGLSGIAVDANHNHAVATVEVPDTSAIMPLQYETNSVLHPAFLDQCLQLVWPLLGYGQPGSEVTSLPSWMERMSISHIRHFKKHKQFHLYGNKYRALSTRDPVKHNILVADTDDPAKVAIQFEGLEVVSVSRKANGLNNIEMKPMCYKQYFEPCFDFLSNADTVTLSPPGPECEHAAQRAENLQKISTEYLFRAVECIREDEVSTFKEHHQMFYRWAQDIVDALPDRPCSKECHDQHVEFGIENVRETGTVEELVRKVGDLIPQILRGEIDLLSVLSENDDLLGSGYETDGFRKGCDHAAWIIDKMAHQNPFLNILEIGAGTGGATLPILQSLGGGDTGKPPRFSHYTYTDISPLFFEKVKAKFQAWEKLISYQTLDITSDPASQDFEPNSYDVIIACNVLHATPIMSHTVANVRRLLKPGGKLLLMEETVLSPKHFVFSLLPGWWVGQDDKRSSGPFLDPEAWNMVLRDNGFYGVDVTWHDFPDISQESGCVMVSTADTVAQVEPNVVIVCLGPTSRSLASLLAGNMSKATGIQPTVADLATANVAGKRCIVLGDLDYPVLSNMTQETFSAVQRIATTASGVLWVIRMGDAGIRSLGASMAVGLARTIRKETSLSFVTLDLGESGSLSDDEAVNKIIQVFDRSFYRRTVLQGDMDFVVQHGMIHVPRIVDDNVVNMSLLQEAQKAPPELQPLQQPGRPLKMAPRSGGIIDEFVFTDDQSVDTPLPKNFIEIEVSCVGLNFRDVLISLGRIPGDYIGHECSGTVIKVGEAVRNFKPGDRVCAITPGSLSCYVCFPEASAAPVPPDMTLETAASIPIAFCTAYYSLVDIGRLSPDETVLIHAAAGGVGQAAIIIAQSIGAQIMATVGSEEKKQFLMKTYHLNEDQIFFSRDTSFAQGIRRATQGRGVDVVLNSVAGDALRATFECLAPFGRFIELGKRDIMRNSTLEMSHFDYNVSFASVDLTLIMKKRPELLTRLLRDALDLFSRSNAQDKWLVTEFSCSEVDTALHSLQIGRTIGKLVIRMADAMVKVHPARRPDEKLLPPDASYIIVGGTRGIGLDIASWLPQKGARNIILISRSGAADSNTTEAIQKLRDQGVAVSICQCDVGVGQDVIRALKPALESMPRVRGVIYGAMVLRDTLYENMKYEDYMAVVIPRVHGIQNLQYALQSLNRTDLDFFINLSSFTSVVGNFGQAAYTATGAFMSAMARYPGVAGVPCTTIDLPMVSGIGYLANNEKRQEQTVEQLGNVWIDADGIHGLIAAAMRKEMEHSCNNHCIVGLHTIRSLSANEFPEWAMDPKISLVRRFSIFNRQADSEMVTQATGKISPAIAIRQCKTRAAAQDLIVKALVGKMSSILMRPEEEINISAPVSSHGLDSLVAIDMRNWITRELDASLQILEILASDSIHALSQVVLDRSGIISADTRAAWVSELGDDNALGDRDSPDEVKQ